MSQQREWMLDEQIEALLRGEEPPAARDAEGEELLAVVQALRELEPSDIGAGDGGTGADPGNGGVLHPLRRIPVVAGMVALLVAVLTIWAALGPGLDAVQAGIQERLRLIPGIGFISGGDQDDSYLSIAEPLSVEHENHTIQVLAFFSDGVNTHLRLRMSGTSIQEWDGPLPLGGPDRADVDLVRLDADGQEQELYWASPRGDGNDPLELSLWFAGLPAHAEQVTLTVRLDSAEERYLDINIPVVTVDDTIFASSVAGLWSEERHGVRVGVSSLGQAPAGEGQERLMVGLLGVSGIRGSELHHFADVSWAREDQTRFPYLTDDTGQRHEANLEESRLSNRENGHLAPWPATLAFNGLGLEDVERLTLHIPSVQVRVPGWETVRFPLHDMAVGDSLAVAEQVTVSGWSVEVQEVRRLDANTFRLDLALEGDAEGVMLQGVIIRPVDSPLGGRDSPRSLGSTGTSSYDEETGALTAWELHLEEAPEEPFYLMFQHPQLVVRGNWSVGLNID